MANPILSDFRDCEWCQPPLGYKRSHGLVLYKRLLTPRFPDVCQLAQIGLAGLADSNRYFITLVSTSPTLSPKLMPIGRKTSLYIYPNVFFLHLHCKTQYLCQLAEVRDSEFVQTGRTLGLRVVMPIGRSEGIPVKHPARVIKG